MDQDSLQHAVEVSRKDPETKSNFLTDIQKNLVMAFSEFVGRPCTMLDINLAIEDGFIEV